MDQVAMFAAEVAATTNEVRTSASSEVVQLSDHELTLVGGGQASMAFY
jgi:hypothetical protein